MQWLLNTAERAGWTAIATPTFSSDTSREDAWRYVADAFAKADLDLADKVAESFSIPRADFSGIEEKAIRLLPEKIARRYHIVPIAETYYEIVMATCDPTDLEAEQAAAFAAGRRVNLRIATPKEILHALNSFYSPDRGMEALLQHVDSSISESVKLLAHLSPGSITARDVSLEPVVKLTNTILHAAVLNGASDIHLEPGKHLGTIRFRIDGVLRDYLQLPLPALVRVVSRIKVLGKMDLTDRIRPHDGRASLPVGDKMYDVRISTVPTRDAEKAVVRVLYGEGARALNELGLPRELLQRIREMISQRDGLLLITGPTGSGKTTTLYSIIQELSDGTSNIMTVEDPVEYALPGITQIQVETKRNVTFASALRAILRQDPDVILVGEIRDAETAEVALHASITGHLVLASLHTNDSIGVVQRLLDLGVERAAIATALRGAIAQRLVRRVCSRCAVPQTDPLTDEELRLEQRYGVRATIRAVGCSHCGRTGYRGRLPLIEALVCTPDFQEKVARGYGALDLRRSAELGGMQSIRSSGLERVAAGETTPREIDRLLGENNTERSASSSELEARKRGRRGRDRRVVSRVLLVISDSRTRALASDALRNEDFEVTQVVLGNDGLQVLQLDQAFSAVIVDNSLPGISGANVLRRIKAIPQAARIPVLVLTDAGDEEANAKVISYGADDYIEKPFDAAQFLSRLKAALRRASARDAETGIAQIVTPG